jgi:ShET2 enterotoxin, N-terminal region
MTSSPIRGPVDPTPVYPQDPDSAVDDASSTLRPASPARTSALLQGLRSPNKDGPSVAREMATDRAASRTAAIRPSNSPLSDRQNASFDKLDWPLGAVLASNSLIDGLFPGGNPAAGNPMIPFEGNNIRVSYDSKYNIVRIYAGADFKTVNVHLSQDRQVVERISAHPPLSDELLEYLVQSQVLHSGLQEIENPARTDAFQTMQSKMFPRTPTALTGSASAWGRPMDPWKQLFFGTHGWELDLSALAPWAASDISPSLTESARQRITSLTLPAGLAIIPEWVTRLPGLKRLEVGKFSGQELRVDNPGIEEIHLLDGNFRKVDVPMNAEVYCRHAREIERQKIKVVYRNPETGNAVREGAALGHLYFAAGHDGKINYRNLNGNVGFATGNKNIVCRHWAIDWLHQIQGHRATRQAERFADRWAQRNINADGIAVLDGKQVETRITELLHGSRETTSVSHSLWGAFLREEFTTLRPGERRHFYLSTTAHAMAVELAVTSTRRGNRYTLTLYDPNLTMTRMRIVEDDLARIERWQARTFLTAGMISAYYGASNSEAATLFSKVPPDAFARPIDKPLFEQHASPRRFREFLTDAERATPQAAHQLFESGHVTPAILRERLSLCPTSATKVALLVSRGFAGFPGLYTALQDGDADAIRAVGEVAGELCSQGEMTNEEFAKLVMARDLSGDPGIFQSQAFNRVAAVRAYGALVARGRATGWLTSQDVFDLLEGRRQRDGAPALYIPLQDGHVEIIRAFGEAIGDPAISDSLTNEQIAKLLRPEVNGRSGLYAAKVNGRQEAIEAFGQVVDDAHRRGQLTDAQALALKDGAA